MVGQFKDDQLQNHRHNINIAGNEAVVSWVNGNYSYGSNSQIATTNQVTGRVGSTTRGKRKGAKYIIKVL